MISFKPLGTFLTVVIPKISMRGNPNKCFLFFREVPLKIIYILFVPFIILSSYAQVDIKYESQKATKIDSTTGSQSNGKKSKKTDAQHGTKTFTKKITDPLLSDSALLAGNNTNINDSTKLLVLNEYTNKKFKNRRTYNRYYNLLEIVKKVYPLAKLAAKRMEEYAGAIDTLKRGQVDDLVAEIEDEIETKYGADLKKLNFKEGVILLKLLDRQTAKTPYVIIKELKSGFSAMIWQSLASLFDYDLKDEFSPNLVEEDMWIEEICVMIDNGTLR